MGGFDGESTEVQKCGFGRLNRKTADNGYGATYGRYLTKGAGPSGPALYPGRGFLSPAHTGSRDINAPDVPVQRTISSKAVLALIIPILNPGVK